MAQTLVRLLILMPFLILSGPVVAVGAELCRDAFTASDPLKPEIRLYPASETLSQRVRDNAPDYWAFTRKNGSSYFGTLLKAEGLVVGDAHPGNFVLAPLGGKLEFHFSDIKDAGEAPLFLDLARLVMSTQAIMRRVDDRPDLKDTASALFNAYVDGLRGKMHSVPEWLESTFAKTMADFEAEEADYLEKQTAYDQFRWEDGAVAPLESDTSLTPAGLATLKRTIDSAVHSYSKDAKVLDYALRVRERGGSRDFLRYWALVDIAEQNSIIEFKQIGAAATESFKVQANTESRYAKAMKTFWTREDSLIDIVEIQGSQFLMRPKKVELFSIPYSPDTKEEQRDLIAIASYDANHLGMLHAKQLGSDSYVKALTAGEAEAKKGLRRFTKDYLKRMKEAGGGL